MQETKRWYESKIIWFAILGLLGSVLMFYFPGIEIPAEASEEAAEQITEAIRQNNWRAAGTAALSFIIAVARLWFTNKEIE